MQETRDLIPALRSSPISGRMFWLLGGNLDIRKTASDEKKVLKFIRPFDIGVLSVVVIFHDQLSQEIKI